MPGVSTSLPSSRIPQAVEVRVSAELLEVRLSDGRTISAPLNWYPRLADGSLAERNHWQLLGDGHGIHWPELDEDISVENLLLGQRSGESPQSLAKWRSRRL